MSARKKIISVFLILIFISGVFVTGFFAGNYVGESNCEVCQPQEINFSLFWEAYHKLQEKFVNPEKINIQEIIYGAISGMVKSLEDPYTVFFPPEETKRFIEDTKGSFEGVGMEIDIKNGQLQVVAPLEGTPAQKAGLRPGDRILAINSTSTADLTVDEAVNMIRGPKGTEVILTIFREGWQKSKEIKMVREVINVPSLKWEMKEDNIAYLKLYQFSQNAGGDFDRVAIEILNSGARGFILDLRDNPGGYLEVAQDIAGWFLERGQIVTIEDFGGKRENIEYKASGNGSLSRYSMVILVNQGSASGSEILAGALRDNLGIKLIGEKSFGKGSVQELEQLSDGSSLKITVAKWLTPKGELITGKGLEPDIKVERTEEDFQEDRDPQLDKAIETLKEMR
jgi:carboxyl-terminal processing protease